MITKDFFRSKKVQAYIFILLIIIALITVGLLILKYYVEGEKNLPFKLEKMVIVSTATPTIFQNENQEIYADLTAINNMYFYINKNDSYKKQDAIKKVIINNFNFEKTNSNGEIKVYKPAKEGVLYTYTDEYVIKDIEYNGGENTSIEALQIGNQGGLIGISIAVENLSQYKVNENEKLQSDGTLLRKGNLTIEDIEIIVSFDLIIETEIGNRFKATVTKKLPGSNILEDGINNIEDTELKDVIFKRI